jgi:SAM-dependent methyltransferase
MSYLHGHHATVLTSHQWRTAENSAGYLLDHLRRGLSVLDVGCGPGTITADFAARVTPGTVIGIDADEGVVDEARRNAAARGLDNIEFAVADVYALDFPDGAFDIVHAHQVLQHLSDPVAALREMRRVCRPTGLVAARDADFGGMVWYPRPPAMDDWLPVYYAAARDAGGEPEAGRRLYSWALEAGFSEASASTSAWCFATPEEREWWSGSWGGRMVESAVAERAVAGGHATLEELQRIRDGWREWAAAKDGWFAVLNCEILCRP